MIDNPLANKILARVFYISTNISAKFSENRTQFYVERWL